jgi:sugar phosphate isomerase/epimerase
MGFDQRSTTSLKPIVMKRVPSPLARRDFLQLVLAALPATSVLSLANRLNAAEPTAATPAKPNSKVAGVQIGLNVPYSFNNLQMSGDDILKNCVQLGVSGVELRTQPVEVFLGAPATLVHAKNPAAADVEKLRDWRRSAPLERVAEFRKLYETAGVLIEIVKVDGIFKMTDEELDYVFALAKGLGGRAISAEISKKDDDLKRLGKFADKHQFMVGYHGHAATAPEHWERAFELARFNGANVDLGHFVAGNNTSPVPFIEKYHDRITHVHVKDRKMHEGANTPFGEGETPIVEVLHLIRDHKWKIQATIEFEYKIPAGSDRMTELAKTVEYCRKALA